MTMRRDVQDGLRARLHEAAEAHQPDHARILARIERGMAEESRPGHRATRPQALGWVRVASATAAVACVLGVGGYAVASAVQDDTPPQRTVESSPTPSPSPSPEVTAPAPDPPDQPSPSTRRETREPTTAATQAPSSPATTRPPAASGTEDGPLWSDGSVDPHSNEYWAQSNLTLKTSERLTALTVRLEVAQTGGVAEAGAWRSPPEEDFSLTVEERDGYLVYTWVLKAGRTLAEGEWMFAGQYDHARGGRDARGDRYTITATAGGEQHSVAGDFSAQDAEDGS